MATSISSSPALETAPLPAGPLAEAKAEEEEGGATTLVPAAPATGTTTTAATTTNANGLAIPRGLQEALRGLAREALRHQPLDVVEFARCYFADLQAAERAQKEAELAREAVSAVVVASGGGGGGGGEESGGSEGDEGDGAAVVAAAFSAAAVAPLDEDDAALVASSEEVQEKTRSFCLPRDGDDASGALRAILGEEGENGEGEKKEKKAATPLLALATAFAAD